MCKSWRKPNRGRKWGMRLPCSLFMSYYSYSGAWPQTHSPGTQWWTTRKDRPLTPGRTRSPSTSTLLYFHNFLASLLLSSLLLPVTSYCTPLLKIFSPAKGDSTKTSCSSFPLAKVVVNNWSIPFLTPLAEVLPKGVWYVKGWPKHTAVSWLVSKCLVSATMYLYSKQPYPHLVDLNVKPWMYLSSDDVCFSIISNGIQLLIFVPWLDNTVMTFMIQCD